MTGWTGSLRYMAPEVALNSPYNEKVDVYSFAIIAWSLLTQKVPFQDFRKDQFIIRVVNGGQR